MKREYETEYLQLGLKIAFYRKLRGLTQEQLAEKIASVKLSFCLQRLYNYSIFNIHFFCCSP